MKIETIVKQLRAKEEKLAKVRDELRDLEDAVKEHRERAEDAYDSLVYAADRLSELC